MGVIKCDVFVTVVTFLKIGYLEELCKRAKKGKKCDVFVTVVTFLKKSVTGLSLRGSGLCGFSVTKTKKITNLYKRKINI